MPDKLYGPNKDVAGTPSVVTPKGPLVVPPGTQERQNYNEAFKKSHTQPDTDIDNQAMHHTLGNGPYQAAPGKSTHDRLTTLELPNPMVSVSGGVQSIPNNAITVCNTTSVDKITSGDFDLTANTWTVEDAGWYLATAKLTYAASTLGIRQWFVYVNAVQAMIDQTSYTILNNTLYLRTVEVIPLNVNDVVNLRTLQNTGAALNCNAHKLSLIKVADL